jgi:hypothetical protein
MRVSLAIVLGLVFSTTGLAQPDRATSAPLVYEFEAAPVTGTNERPQGEILSVRNGRNRHSLIRPRAQLVDQLRASIEAL